VPQATAGIYKFRVKAVEFKSSGVYVTEETDKNGRLYFKPTLEVSIPGNELTWRCRSLLSTHPRMVYKINHLREMAGQIKMVDGKWTDIDGIDQSIEFLVGGEGYGKFIPDTSGYNDLELVDFLPDRKINEMNDAEKAVYVAAVAAYADDCPIGDTSLINDKQTRLDKARELAGAAMGAKPETKVDSDIPF